jgi:hypothetical protein
VKDARRGDTTPSMPPYLAVDTLTRRIRTALLYAELDTLWAILPDIAFVDAFRVAIRCTIWTASELDGKASPIGPRNERDDSQPADKWLRLAVEHAAAAIWSTPNPRARFRRLLVAAIEGVFAHFGLKASPWADVAGGTCSPFIVAVDIAIRASGGTSPGLGNLAVYVRKERAAA